MKVEVNDPHFNCGKVPTEISFAQYIRLKITRKTKVFEAIKRGWRGSLPFYIFKCRSCGELALDYEHGYNGRLDCQICNPKNSKKEKKTNE